MATQFETTLKDSVFHLSGRKYRKRTFLDRLIVSYLLFCLFRFFNAFGNNRVIACNSVEISRYFLAGPLHAHKVDSHHRPAFSCQVIFARKLTFLRYSGSTCAKKIGKVFKFISCSIIKICFILIEKLIIFSSIKFCQIY